MEITTGALSLVETALHAGVEVCFANPGTTEMPIVAVLGTALACPDRRGHRVSGRRKRPVHAASALVDVAGERRRDHRGVRKPPLPDFAGRACPRPVSQSPDPRHGHSPISRDRRSTGLHWRRDSACRPVVCIPTANSPMRSYVRLLSTVQAWLRRCSPDPYERDVQQDSVARQFEDSNNDGVIDDEDIRHWLLFDGTGSTGRTFLCWIQTTFEFMTKIGMRAIFSWKELGCGM